MGYRPLSSIDWTTTKAYSTRATSAPSAKAFFKTTNLHDDLNPALFQMRESRDSPANPASTPIMIYSDVTGSMGDTAHYMAKKGFTTIVEQILERKPVTDPHILLGAVGDAVCDHAPLQATQFETSTALLEQLDKIWVEANGGGNSFESYNAPWHFAAFHTSCDAFEKRGEKGFIFTVGDECAPPDLGAKELTNIYHRGDETVATNRQLLDLLATKYHVFHICLTTVGLCGHGGDLAEKVKKSWTELLGQNVLFLEDPNKTAELIISTMQIVKGDDAATVAKSWGGGTDVVISNATKGLAVAKKSGGAGGLVRF